MRSKMWPNILRLMVVIFLVWVTELRAQESNILPDISVPGAAGVGEWPIVVSSMEEVDDEKRMTGSMLHFCISRSSQLPEQLAKACEELILAATYVHIERLKTFTTLQSEVVLASARFRAEHTKETLENQRQQGVRLFWLVLTVVVIGIITALLQFIRSFGVNSQSGSAEIVISNNQFKFQTTWLGALLLGLSMGFLFLYLVFVYPISFVS